MPRKPTIDDYVGAILDRDEGVPYSKVLERYNITSHQFFMAIRHRLNNLIQSTDGEIRQALEEISKNETRERELFNMGKEFIEEQYNQVLAGKKAQLYHGTLVHPENIEHLVYYALISKNPKLASNDRRKVIEVIKNLPYNLKDYFDDIKLGGLMAHAFEKGKRGSPLAVLEVFDRVYQRNTEDASLFDLSHKYHLHKWGDTFQAPNSYWKNPSNVEEAVYHTLTEEHPKLASTDRSEVIKGIKNYLPTNLKDYFIRIGLNGLMSNAFEKEKIHSPLAVLEVFDRVYQRNTEDASLFDLTQEEHLHKWDFNVPRSYWKNTSNVEEAVYHILTEENPQLASNDRKEVIKTIKNFPINIYDYFIKIGLSGLMRNAFQRGKKHSLLAVLEVFDRVYQRETGNPSLFDKNEDSYLEFSGKERNRLIR